MSFDIAISIFRKFSAWRSLADLNSSFEILVRPSTRKATSSPNRRRSSSTRREGVLDRVVEQAGGDRHRVEPHLGEDARHLERVDQVGLAGEPLLALVDLGGEDVGALQQGEIALGVVLEDAIRDVVEAQHAPRSAAAGRRTRAAPPAYPAAYGFLLWNRLLGRLPEAVSGRPRGRPAGQHRDPDRRGEERGAEHGELRRGEDRLRREGLAGDEERHGEADAGEGARPGELPPASTRRASPPRRAGPPAAEASSTPTGLPTHQAQHDRAASAPRVRAKTSARRITPAFASAKSGSTT